MMETVPNFFRFLWEADGGLVIFATAAFVWKVIAHFSERRTRLNSETNEREFEAEKVVMLHRFEASQKAFALRFDAYSDFFKNMGAIEHKLSMRLPWKTRRDGSKEDSRASDRIISDREELFFAADECISETIVELNKLLPVSSLATDSQISRAFEAITTYARTNREFRDGTLSSEDSDSSDVLHREEESFWRTLAVLKTHLKLELGIQRVIEMGGGPPELPEPPDWRELVPKAKEKTVSSTGSTNTSAERLD